MKPGFFEKMDQLFFDRTKSLRETQLPPGALDGFENQVLARLRAENARAKGRGLLGAALGVLAAAGIGVFFALRTPEPVAVAPSEPEGRLVSASETAAVPEATEISTPSAKRAALDEEVEALRELGEWSEEDEAAVLGLDDPGFDLGMSLARAPRAV